MKQKRFKTIALAVFASVLLTGCEKETVLPFEDSPSEIKTYLSTHFPTNTVIQVIKDKDGFQTTYDLMLEGSIGLEFNGKKEIIDIDGSSKLPDSVIPTAIGTYVSANYPANVITDWELDDKNQQVGLDNGLQLEFNMDGDFLRLDN